MSHTTWNYCKDMYVTRKFDEHAVMENVIEKNDVKLIMEEVKEALDKNKVEWSTDRHGYRSTVDLPIVYNPEFHLKQENLPVTVNVANQILKEKIAHQYEKMYGFPKDDISYQEAFLIRYTPDTQDHLAPHHDGSPLSFVCALNDKKEYVGGGTRFLEKDETCSLKNAGDCCVFSGQQEHEGLPVTEGERYVLAGFVNFGPTEDACDRIVSKEYFVNHKYRDEYAKSCSECINNGLMSPSCPGNCKELLENVEEELRKDLLHSHIVPSVIESDEMQDMIQESNSQGKNINFKLLTYLENYDILDGASQEDIYTIIEQHEPGVKKIDISHIDNPKEMIQNLITTE